MDERKKVASKTYVSKYKDLSFSFIVDVVNGDKVSDTIRFVNGEFSTVLQDEQEHLEGSALFGNGAVWVKPSPRLALESAAVSLRAAAVKAGGAAKAAEDALAAFDKAAAPVKTSV